MVRLSQRERDILACIEHQGNEPISTIRKQTGFRDHTIRYYIDALRGKGVLRGRAPVIDVYRLGYGYYHVYFSTPSEKRDQTERFLQALMNAPEVAMVAPLEGDYQYVVSVCALSVNDVIRFLHNLVEQFGNGFFEKEFVVPHRFHLLPRQYLAPRFSSLPAISYGVVEQFVSIDDTDRLVLSALASSPDSSQRDLAGQVQVPISSFSRRVRNLEAQGVIRGYRYGVDLSQTGMQDYRLLVTARGVNLELGRALRAFSKANTNVIRLIECFGAWDFEMDVEVSKSEEALRIASQVRESFARDLLSVRLLHVSKPMKHSIFPIGALRSELLASNG